MPAVPSRAVPSRAILTTADVPAGDGFDHWRDMLARQAVPVSVGTDDPEGFSAIMRATDFGDVKTVITENTSVEVERTRALIRRSDPVTFYLVLNFAGSQQMWQDRTCAVLGHGDMTLLHSSRISRSRADPGLNHQRGAVVTLDTAALPIPPNRLSQLLALRLGAEDDLVSLVSQHIRALGTGSFMASDAARLSSVTMDLLALLLTRRLDLEDGLPAETSENALFARVQAFVLARLGDPGLTAEAVAAAHHMSLRTLQRLFRANDTSVVHWIRSQRLERSRRDLIDPALAGRPVRTIASRWGFPSAAHYSRAFKEAYGLSPTEYRADALRARPRPSQS